MRLADFDWIVINSSAGSPGAQVTVDSCLLRAHCNRERRLGIARQISQRLIAAGRLVRDVATKKELEVALAFTA